MVLMLCFPADEVEECVSLFINTWTNLLSKTVLPLLCQFIKREEFQPLPNCGMSARPSY